MWFTKSKDLSILKTITITNLLSRKILLIYIMTSSDIELALVLLKNELLLGQYICLPC